MRVLKFVGGLVIALVSLASPAVAADDDRLAEAAKRRDVRAVTTLLQQRVDPSAPMPDGSTPLHWAVHRDSVEIVDLLIAAGAKTDVVNDYGVMPLHLAATNRNAAIVERLLKAGANANAALPTGETVLMAAARTGQLGVMKLLLTRGADPNPRQASKGQTALMWAVNEHHLEAVRLLLDHGADINARTSTGFTALMFATREPSLDVVKLLVERGGGLNETSADGATPLLVATVRGHVDIARYLLDRGARPDGDPKAGYTPLHWASGKFESVVSFDYPDAPGEWNALAGIPVRAGKIELIKTLIAHGATVDASLTTSPPRYGFHRFGAKRGPVIRGATPFYMAASVGDVDVMRLLLAAGANPFFVTKDKNTPVLAAAGLAYEEEESHLPQGLFVDAVRFMADLGADLNAANSDGFTPAHAAAWNGFDQVLQLLHDRGANLNGKTSRSETPLDIAEGYHIPAYFDRPVAAALLHKLGAVGGVERSGFLAGLAKLELEEQEKSKRDAADESKTGEPK